MASIPKYFLTEGSNNYKITSGAGAYKVPAIATELGVTAWVAGTVIQGLAKNDISGSCFRIVIHGTEVIGGVSRSFSETLWCAASKIATARTALQGQSFNTIDPITKTPTADTVTIEHIGPKRHLTLS
jgi:hypothetical protein